MKIVRLMGGLGNQMFQYAFGNLWTTDPYFDISWFKRVKKRKNLTPRTYELDFFKCSNIHLINVKTIKNKILTFFKLVPKIPTIFEKPEDVYHPELLAQEDCVIEGYFQVARYCEAIRPLLLKQFVPAQKENKQNQDLLNQIKSGNSISVHIRRGDYLKVQQIHGLCSIEYYQNAIQYMAKRVKKPIFFIFSDDMNWVKENLKITHPHYFVDINKGRQSAWDMWLMKNCRHNIVANSTFSWWGAWLNEHKNKIVIAPKTWYASGQKTEIIPDDWIRI